MERCYKELEAAISANALLTEQALVEVSAGKDEDFGLIFEAQRYSLLGGGKRVRPFLVNETCAMLGGDIERSMPLACAIEMIHTYSLIHDDLPCMDDDDMRRGKPSNHKVFGYANALLAGDALLTGAFDVIASASSLDGETRAKAVSVLSRAAGQSGMIAGQVMDLDAEKTPITFEQLLNLHSLKTAALIEGAVLLGCLAAGYDTDSEQATSLSRYAENVGIAFQVVDDILDKTSSAEVLGKPTGSDSEQNKTTFLSFYSVEQAREYADHLTEMAISEISEIDGSQRLTDFACYLLDRQK
jgi:geranylgeranyl diphosphate synthase type II